MTGEVVLKIGLIAWIAWIAVGTLTTVAMIGKPRTPITPRLALTVLCINTALIVAIVAFWDAR